MTRMRLWVVVLVGLSTAAATARGADPFTLTAEGPTGTRVSVSDSNVVDLVGDLIDAQNQFAPLSNQPISATLRYGGVNDAVLFSRNAAGTSATITIPSTGFSRTFSAGNQGDLEDDIRRFFEKEGADAYADFLREINRLTSIGVTDGNPLATTAILSDLGFYRFGFRTRPAGDDPLRLPGGWDLKLLGGVSNSDDADGWFAGIGIGKNWKFSDRIGLTWANNFRYRDVEGADVYQLASTIGLPISIIRADPDGGLSWHLTPAFVSGFGGSWDLAAGGIVVGGQLTSSLAYHTGGWTFVLGNQIGFFEGVPIEWSDVRFETETGQQILKNGIQVIRDLGNGGFVDAGVAYTNFLDDAAIDSYLTPTAGIGFRIGDASMMRVGYQGDFGDGYTSHGGNLSFLFGY